MWKFGAMGRYVVEIAMGCLSKDLGEQIGSSK
ncbi:hypothetical protein DFR59_1152 [Falsibacillus pallidus]|uniref:Uncharacterized protein n=1 Tax=Falsibacillus pallidus TaxID=493781 RepID=A0A370G7N3_9BACI|nr:hypothetical protein DFR59_1152 [Falsibacillus pallidus]